MHKLLPLDFYLRFCQEKIPGQGEDSYCHCIGDTAALLGVFDGCGGAGAKRHSYYYDHTEAFMASRLVAGGMFSQFYEQFPMDEPLAEVDEQLFLAPVVELLRQQQPPKEGGLVIKGSMVRTLPTTAAMALVRSGDSCLEVNALWAGDSRVYVLNSDGLAQLTVDDTTSPDPMQTLYEDGVLKNIYCADRAVRLQRNKVRLTGPFVVFAATDGCFGHLPSPMEFEAMLLETLFAADSPAQWEAALVDKIGQVAGDDHALCLASFGYKSFEALQAALQPRYAALYAAHLSLLESIPAENRGERTAQWQSYKQQYLRFLKDGQS